MQMLFTLTFFSKNKQKKDDPMLSRRTYDKLKVILLYVLLNSSLNGGFR